jgi:uncharacterized protein YbjQ (UPF0145 family)
MMEVAGRLGADEIVGMRFSTPGVTIHATEMSGKWVQGGASLDVVMKRVKEAPKV